MCFNFYKFQELNIFYGSCYNNKKIKKSNAKKKKKIKKKLFSEHWLKTTSDSYEKFVKKRKLKIKTKKRRRKNILNEINATAAEKKI